MPVRPPRTPRPPPTGGLSRALACAIVVAAAPSLAQRPRRAPPPAPPAAASAPAPEPPAPPPPADPAVEARRAEARAAIQRGEAFFARENYEAALTEFERVYELLEGRPTRYVVLFNIAQCQERLFRYDVALRFYQRYLDEGGPAAEDRATVTATMRALESLLGTVELASNVTPTQGVELWLDDRRVGAELVPELRVPSGRHTIELRARGYAPSRQEVSVQARGRRSVRFVLEALSRRRGISPAFFWTAAGFTVAAGAAAAGLGGYTLSLNGEANRLLNSPDPEQQYLVWRGTSERIRTFALATDVTLGVTALFGASALVLAFVTEWRRPAAETAPADRASRGGARLVALPSAGPGGFGVAGEF